MINWTTILTTRFWRCSCEFIMPKQINDYLAKKVGLARVGCTPFTTAAYQRKGKKKGPLEKKNINSR